jgi:hypothetical protein
MPELSDTSPEAERLQLDLYRAMAPGEKLALVLDLIDAAELFSRAGIRMRHPRASEQEITLRLATIKYGPDLARTVYGRDLAAERRE